MPHCCAKKCLKSTYRLTYTQILDIQYFRKEHSKFLDLHFFHFCTVVFHFQKVTSNTLPVFEFSLRGDQLQEEEELGFLARGNNAKSLDAPKVMAEVCDYRGCFGFLLCLGWRVGEHQFSSPNCPRSFQCGEHFPSSPVSQATIASTRKKKSHCKIHIHARILSYFSSPVLVKRYYYEEKYF